MPTFRNRRRDKFIADCGGVGGDNVLGTVEEAGAGGTFTPVKGAKVRIDNLTNGEWADATTNRQGKYDEDVNSDCNHLIYVSASWKDAAKRRRFVRGNFRCPCEDEKRHEIDDADERLETISRLEMAIADMVAAGEGGGERAILQQGEIIRLLVEDLNAIAGDDDREKQRKDLDKRIREEINALFQKYYSMRGRVPNQHEMWLFMQEMIALLFKLVQKAFWLQEQPLPEVPKPEPRPPRPPDWGDFA